MSRLAAQAKMQFYPTQDEIVKFIQKLIVPYSYERVLDPCAGEGQAIYKLSEAWRMSAFGVEPNKSRFEKLRSRLGRQNVLDENFEDVRASNFPLIFVNPPYHNRREIRWVNMVADALSEDGIAIWIVPEKTLKDERFISAFASKFKDEEVWKYPQNLFNEYKQYIVRARARRPEFVGRSLERDQDFSRSIEVCNIAGDSTHVSGWKVPSTRETSKRFKFVRKDLVWEDVFPQVMSAWARVPYVHSSIYETYEKYIAERKEDEPDYIEKPYYLNYKGAQVWTLHYVIIDKEIMMMEMIGRRNAIEAIEAALKSGKNIKTSRGAVKLNGGGSSHKERYIHTMSKLPIGLFHSIWIHQNMTDNPVSSYRILGLPMNLRDAYTRISNHLGLCVFPEWAHPDVYPYGVSSIYISSSWNKNIKNQFVTMDRMNVMSGLTKKAVHHRNMGKSLPDPEPLKAEEIFPMMPLSANNYAQLVLQGDANNYPMQIDDDKFVMFAEQIRDTDTEVEENIAGETEITTIHRTDASRVTVFHYTGPKAGEWEIFQSGVNEKEAEAEAEEKEQEEKNEYKPQIA